METISVIGMLLVGAIAILAIASYAKAELKIRHEQKLLAAGFRQVPVPMIDPFDNTTYTTLVWKHVKDKEQ